MCCRHSQLFPFCHRRDRVKDLVDSPVSSIRRRQKLVLRHQARSVILLLLSFVSPVPSLAPLRLTSTVHLLSLLPRASAATPSPRNGPSRAILYAQQKCMKASQLLYASTLVPEQAGHDRLYVSFILALLPFYIQQPSKRISGRFPHCQLSLFFIVRLTVTKIKLRSTRTRLTLPNTPHLADSLSARF